MRKSTGMLELLILYSIEIPDWNEIYPAEATVNRILCAYWLRAPLDQSQERCAVCGGFWREN